MTREEIRKQERESIRIFLKENQKHLNGDVLDFGCGEEPYKEIVEGNYDSYDPVRNDLWPSKTYNTVMCNQVLEEVDNPLHTLKELSTLVEKGGIVLLTFASGWEEWGYPDRWRFTKAGMEYLTKQAGFEVIKTKERTFLPFDDFKLTLGWGFVLQK